jgi:stage II sporulation protein D
MMGALVLAAVLQVPVAVRILERSQLTALQLNAATLSCDGQLLVRAPQVPFELRVKTESISVGDRACLKIEAVGPFQVRAGELVREYFGNLDVSVEKGSLRLINRVELEEYLAGVLAGEADTLSDESLGAQAVVSRTFAFASRPRHRDSDFCDLTHCQLYRGREGVSARLNNVLKKTTGQVLLRGGVALKPTYFHQACGGHTSSAEAVFGDDFGIGVGDQGQTGALCAGAKDFEWHFETEKIALQKALGLSEKQSTISVLQRDSGGRILALSVFGTRFSGSQFLSAMGRAFGFQSLRSARFEVSQVEDEIRFQGKGLGHGVGLCQFGAEALAQQGASTVAILLHYFPDFSITKQELPTLHHKRLQHSWPLRF